MNMDQLNWIKGLDQSGWVAAALFAVFFIISALTIVIMLRLNAENKKARKKKSLKKSQAAPSNTTRTAPVKSPIKPVVKNTEKEKDDSSPLEEAEVYIAYGLNKQAINLLEKYLKEHPSDKTALEMLKKAQSNL